MIDCVFVFVRVLLRVVCDKGNQYKNHFLMEIFEVEIKWLAFSKIHRISSDFHHTQLRICLTYPHSMYIFTQFAVFHRRNITKYCLLYCVWSASIIRYSWIHDNADLSKNVFVQMNRKIKNYESWKVLEWVEICFNNFLLFLRFRVFAR